MPAAHKLLLVALAAGCSGPSDPLASVDTHYSVILAELNAASRDTTRNIFNKDARFRKVSAEKKLAAFFQDPAVIGVIGKARQAPEGSPLRIKGEAYWREAVFGRSWTAEEKEQEAELLAAIDATSGDEAVWVRQDGKREISLKGEWNDVSTAADTLTTAQREELASEYVNHRMRIIGDDLKHLVKLRNRVAQREGFENYWRLALYYRGLSQDDVDKLVQELNPVISPVNAATSGVIEARAKESGVPNTFAHRPLLMRQAGLEKGRDETESAFDTDLAENRIVTSFKEMGLDLGTLQIFTGPSRTTVRGAYSFPIRPPELLATVVSMDSRFDLWFYEAMMHEVGYASWWRSLGPEALPSPVLWEPPPAYMEGYAQLFERILYEPAWLARYTPDLDAPQREALAAWRRHQMATWVTESIVQTAVERRVYEDPNNWGAVARFCSDMESTYQVYSGPPPLNDQGVAWCDALLTPLIWHYPGYAQNYLFSYVTEARLYDALVAAVGDPVANPKVGPWLKDNFASKGNLVPFAQRLDKVSPGSDRIAALRRYIGEADGP